MSKLQNLYKIDTKVLSLHSNLYLMTTIRKLKDLEVILNKSSEKKVLGLVPTMGSLHEGHISLVKSAVKLCNEVWVSIFVNPTQFNDINDYKRYPTDLKKDIDKIKSTDQNVNIFIPNIDDIYGLKIFKEKFNFQDIGKVLEGIKRPEKSVCSRNYAKYALEVNSGWFKDNNINVGDVIDIETAISNDD